MKLNLGDTVEVSSIGIVEGAEMDAKGEVRYKVNKGVGEGCAVYMKESCLYPLPGPEDVGVADGSKI